MPLVLVSARSKSELISPLMLLVELTDICRLQNSALPCTPISKGRSMVSMIGIFVLKSRTSRTERKLTAEKIQSASTYLRRSAMEPCVYDIKTGQRGLSPARTTEIATNVFKAYPATQRIIVSEIR